MDRGWPRRALVAYLLVVATIVVFGFMLQGFKDQLDGFRRQIDVTNANLWQIQRQECLDANAAAKAAAFATASKPVYRTCP